MRSNRSTLAAAANGFFRVLAVCIPVLVLLSVAQGQHAQPSAEAKGMPGALGTMEYKPTDWKGNGSHHVLERYGWRRSRGRRVPYRCHAGR